MDQALRRPSKELAGVIWRTLIGMDSLGLKARYRPNKQFRQCHEEPSSLVLLLREHKWIPQGKRGLVRPADASRKFLPKDFGFDSDWRWLRAIGFGENDAKKSEERREKQAQAKALGVPNLDVLEQALRIAKLCPDKQEQLEQILQGFERQQHTRGDGRNKDGVRGGGGADAVPSSDHRNGVHGGSQSNRAPQNPTASPKEPRHSNSVGRRKIVSNMYTAVSSNNVDSDPDGLRHEQRMVLEEKAIQLILKEEPKLQRTQRNNPGYDLFEANKSKKKIKLVEVKAMTGCLENRPVELSRTQFVRFAQEYGKAYWLYVVEYADDPEKARIVPIQDPFGKATKFCFDYGWLSVSDEGKLGTDADAAIRSNSRRNTPRRSS